MRLALALAVLVVTVAAPSALAGEGRLAVGLVDGASVADVARLVEKAADAPVDRRLAPVGALVVPAVDPIETARRLRSLPGVEYVELIERSRSISFLPTDPLAGLQWYLSAIRAFDFWPESVPALAPVKVAVIDTGIDASHPEFAGRIAALRSFVSGRPDQDRIGHGTFVAGEIAAALDNGQGIAGAGFPVQLIVAKIADKSGDNISVEAEANAIRWAADQGAQVINLSLGGPRDPNDPAVDTYSELEQDAIAYARSKGALIVAAAGNTDCAIERCPGRYAGYPAALPHVIGVAALAVDGSIASFSNRDPLFVDLAAPGVGIVSTFPRALTDEACGQPGYSICAAVGSPVDTLLPYRNGNGTSFAAPLVSAAAALLLAQNPTLEPSQAGELLESSAVDISRTGRDAATGMGRLDVAAALSLAASGAFPPVDVLEANDDAGDGAARVALRSRRTIDATIDAFDDPSDVYRVYLRRGTRLTASLTGTFGGKATLVLWGPGTKHVEPVTRVALRSGYIVAYRKGAKPVLRATIGQSGFYYVEVKAPRGGAGTYRLTLETRR